MSSRRRLALAAAVLVTITGAISAFSLVGKVARRIDVITLFATGFAGGASVVAARRSRQSDAQEERRDDR